MISLYDRMIEWVSAKVPESIMLLFVRIVLAGIFWRSGQTKIEEGT